MKLDIIHKLKYISTKNNIKLIFRGSYLSLLPYICFGSLFICFLVGTGTVIGKCAFYVSCLNGLYVIMKIFLFKIPDK